LGNGLKPDPVMLREGIEDIYCCKPLLFGWIMTDHKKKSRPIMCQQPGNTYGVSVIRRNLA